MTIEPYSNVSAVVSRDQVLGIGIKVNLPVMDITGVTQANVTEKKGNAPAGWNSAYVNAGYRELTQSTAIRSL